MARGYRQSQEGDIWHFCSNCSNWPRLKFIEQWENPIAAKSVASASKGAAREDVVAIFWISTENHKTSDNAAALIKQEAHSAISAWDRIYLPASRDAKQAGNRRRYR
jgi:hypothetical protein